MEGGVLVFLWDHMFRTRRHLTPPPFLFSLTNPPKTQTHTQTQTHTPKAKIRALEGQIAELISAAQQSQAEQQQATQAMAQGQQQVTAMGNFAKALEAQLNEEIAFRCVGGRKKVPAKQAMGAWGGWVGGGG
jgi:hypothetical protein